jgi:hypothetical protein
VRPTTLVRICDECSFGNYQNKCVVCGGEGISDAFYCFECTRLEKDRDGCPKIINLGSSRTDVSNSRSLLSPFLSLRQLTNASLVILPKENESVDGVLTLASPETGHRVSLRWAGICYWTCTETERSTFSICSLHKLGVEMVLFKFSVYRRSLCETLITSTLAWYPRSQSSFDE